MSNENEELEEGTEIDSSESDLQLADLTVLSDVETEDVMLSISSTSLCESLDGLFDRMRHSIPGKRMQRKLQLNDLDINGYLQPPQIFDPTRLHYGKAWKGLGSEILTPKSINTFMKIKPLKGFKNPLKLAKKCLPKIPTAPSQSFVLFHGDWQYLPPPDLQPLPHLLQRSVSESFIQYSPTLNEMKMLGKYETPKVPKNKRRAKTAIGIPVRLPEKQKEIPEERYQAPAGSKDNYSCKKIIELTDANRALEEVSSLLSLHVLRKPSKKRQVVATLVAHNIPDILVDSLTSIPDDDNDLLVLDGSTSQSSVILSPGVSDKDLDLLTNNSDEGNEIKNNETEGDILIKSEESLESEIKQEDLPSFTIDLIEMNLERPHFVRRTVKESSSVAKWIDTNILGEFHKMKRENAEFGLISEGRTKTEISYKPPRSPLLETDPLNKETRAKPRTFSTDFHEKLKSNESKSCQEEETWPTAVNSIDDFLKEQEENPAVFHVFKTLCKKRFANYGIEDLRTTKSSLDDGYGGTYDTISNDKDAIHEKDNENEYMDNWWNHSGKYVIFAEDLQTDENYFASGEEEQEESNSTNTEEDEIQRSTSVDDVWAFHPWYKKVYGLNAEEIEEDELIKNTNCCDDPEMDRLSEEANFDNEEQRSTLSSLGSFSNTSLDDSWKSERNQNHETPSMGTFVETFPSPTESDSVLSSAKRSRTSDFLKNKFSSFRFRRSRTVTPLSSLPSETFTVTEWSENEDVRNCIEIGSNTTKQRTKGPKIIQRCLSRVSSFCTLLFGSSKFKGQRQRHK